MNSLLSELKTILESVLIVLLSEDYIIMRYIDKIHDEVLPKSYVHFSSGGRMSRQIYYELADALGPNYCEYKGFRLLFIAELCTFHLSSPSNV